MISVNLVCFASSRGATIGSEVLIIWILRERSGGRSSSSKRVDSAARSAVVAIRTLSAWASRASVSSVIKLALTHEAWPDLIHRSSNRASASSTNCCASATVGFPEAVVPPLQETASRAIVIVSQTDELLRKRRTGPSSVTPCPGALEERNSISAPSRPDETGRHSCRVPANNSLSLGYSETKDGLIRLEPA